MAAARRKALLDFLCQGRARVPSGSAASVTRLSPPSIDGLPAMEGLVLEHLAVETEAGEHCPLLLVRQERLPGEGELRHGALQPEQLDQDDLRDARRKGRRSPWALRVRVHPRAAMEQGRVP